MLVNNIIRRILIFTIFTISSCHKDKHRLKLMALDPSGEPVHLSYLMVFSTDTICDTADVGFDLHQLQLKEGVYHVRVQAPLYKDWDNDSFLVNAKTTKDTLFINMEYVSESLLDTLELDYIGHPY